MIVYRIPETIQTLVFDIDGTLYENQEYMKAQTQVQVRALAREWNQNEEDLWNAIGEWQNKWQEQNPGMKPSLGNSLLGAFGFSIQDSCKLRSRTIVPEEYLVPDTALNEDLGLLKENYRIWALTNNPEDIGWRNLQALGIAAHFQGLVGMDRTGASKPQEACYRVFNEVSRSDFPSSLYLGDRYEVDLVHPLSKGAGGILIEKRQDLGEFRKIIMDPLLG